MLAKSRFAHTARFVAAVVVVVILPMPIIWKLEFNAMSREPALATGFLLLQSTIGIIPGCIAFQKRMRLANGYGTGKSISLFRLFVTTGLVGGLFALFVWIPTKVTTSHTHRLNLMPYVAAYYLIGALYTGLTALAFAAGFGQRPPTKV